MPSYPPTIHLVCRLWPYHLEIACYSHVKLSLTQIQYLQRVLGLHSTGNNWNGTSTLCSTLSLIGKHARFSKKVCHIPPMYVDSYLPSSSYSLYSEHYNIQLVCNKQWCVQSWTFLIYWCCDDVNPYQIVMRLYNHVVWLVSLLSWPSMWWTGPFTPTQKVSWLVHVPQLSYIFTRSLHS